VKRKQQLVTQDLAVPILLPVPAVSIVDGKELPLAVIDIVNFAA
jgi:hypothetical protein